VTLPRVDMAPQRLDALLAGMAGDVPSVTIRGLALDSRAVGAGELFLAYRGGHRHGLEFAHEAVARGAAAVAWDDADSAPDMPVPAVRVPGLAERVGEIAARFYGHPSRSLFVTGVTGTDGKTSCCHILAQAMTHLSGACGYMGTLGYGFLPELEEASHTTPDPVRLQGWLARLRAAGADSVGMEVSSHALAQARADAVTFDTAVLTNIGRDHLDYHGDMGAYVAAKRRLFEMPGLRAVILNGDDDYGQRWLDELPADRVRVVYGLETDELRGKADHWLTARDVLAQPQGLALDIATSWGDVRLQSRLLGRFNAYNLLATLAVLLMRGYAPDAAAAALERVDTVPGRMEPVAVTNGHPLVVVDYAHTPGALEQALRALCEHVPGRVHCVFGCGGDRDPGKRPLMGEVAARYADDVWLTDDNPRGEDPAAIVAQIRNGMPTDAAVAIQHDRAAAIAAAIGAAGPGDGVLIAGKGHENVQIVDGRRRPFNDREQARRALEAA